VSTEHDGGTDCVARVQNREKEINAIEALADPCPNPT